MEQLFSTFRRAQRTGKPFKHLQRGLLGLLGLLDIGCKFDGIIGCNFDIGILITFIGFIAKFKQIILVIMY